MLQRMQLAALGSNAWLPSARCCGCIPVAYGGMIICLILFLRGIELTSEVRDRQEGWTILGRPSSDEPLLISVGRMVLFTLGVGDIIASLVGSISTMLRKATPVAILTLWLLVRPVLEVFVTLVAFTYETSGFAHSTLLFLAFAVVLLDIYFALAGLELLLVITLRGTVAVHFLMLVRKAQRQCLEMGQDACSREHLMAALLEDDTARMLLQKGKVDVGMLASLLPPPSQRRYVLPPDGDLLFAPDAEADLYNACLLQQQEGDQQLTADHLLLAICGSGHFKLGKYKFEVDTHSILTHLRAAKGSERCVDENNVPLGVTLLGCLPLEETVLTWTIVRLAAAIVWLVFWIQGTKAWFNVTDVYEYAALGRNHTWQTRVVELITTFVGGIFSAIALAGILNHRDARWMILEKARDFGMPAAGLGHAFEVVRANDAPEAAQWLQALKTGPTRLRWFFFYSVFEACCDVPIFGMLLAMGNVCGAYMHGVMGISRIGLFFSSTNPMHCEYSDWALLFFVGVWVAVKCGAIWATFLLWHLYQHGWVTNEDKGIGYLKSATILPDWITRSLAGLPRYLPRGHSPYKEHDPEAKPIYL